MQIATAAAVDVAVGMEDPFDDVAMDTISLFEVLDHVSMVDKRLAFCRVPLWDTVVNCCIFLFR